jgi:hypothetical protein
MWSGKLNNFQQLANKIITLVQFPLRKFLYGKLFHESNSFPFQGSILESNQLPLSFFGSVSRF